MALVNIVKSGLRFGAWMAVGMAISYPLTQAVFAGSTVTLLDKKICPQCVKNSQNTDENGIPSLFGSLANSESLEIIFGKTTLPLPKETVFWEVGQSIPNWLPTPLLMGEAKPSPLKISIPWEIKTPMPGFSELILVPPSVRNGSGTVFPVLPEINGSAPSNLAADSKTVSPIS